MIAVCVIGHFEQGAVVDGHRRVVRVQVGQCVEAQLLAQRLLPCWVDPAGLIGQNDECSVSIDSVYELRYVGVGHSHTAFARPRSAVVARLRNPV